MGLFSKKKTAEPTVEPAPVVDPTVASKTDVEDGDDAVADAPLEPTATTASEKIEYPEGLKLGFILLSIFVTMFLVALDRLIIATAIPQITNEFHSITDIGWYGSAYMLATGAFQLLFGKFYTFWSIKYVFLFSVFLFEVGSAVCGAAPTSIAFIVGRAIAGIGGAGIFSGVITILVYAVPLHKRPLYQGLFGAIFGVASVVGPLLGGAFTTNVTWRWCFYINLPFGGIAMAIILFLLPVPDRDTTKLPMRAKLAQLDFFGTAAFIPGIVCLLLALQWGGFDYPWRSARIIALLVLAGLLIITFCVVQVVKPETATVPPRIFMQRSIMAGAWVTICVGSQMMIFVYFVPVWFQAIQGVSAVQSGIRMLPMMLSMVVASGASGAITAKIGYYLPTMFLGIVLMSIGAGLITTFGLGTTQAEWVGYQFIYGFGMGCTFQAPNLAAQTVLPTKDVPIGTSLMFFSQLLGGAIFTSVGQNVLDGELLKRLSSLPGFTPEFLKNTGATSLTNLPASIRSFVISAYNEALRKVFQVGLVLVCLTVLGAVFMEWRSVKERKLAQDKKDAEKGAAAAEAAAAKTAGGEHDDAVTDAEATDVDEKAAERRAEHDHAKEEGSTDGVAAAAETSAARKEEA